MLLELASQHACNSYANPPDSLGEVNLQFFYYCSGPTWHVYFALESYRGACFSYNASCSTMGTSSQLLHDSWWRKYILST